MQVLQEYYWPGNLRELEGVVLRSVALARRVMVRNGGEMGVSSEEGAGVVVRLRFRVVGGSEAGDIKGSHA